MIATGALAVILAAPPTARGAAEALAVAAPGAQVLLTGAGLAWLADPVALGALRAAAADLALCSASAHDRGLDAAATPPGVRWSSLATWLAQREGRPFGLVLP